MILFFWRHKGILFHQIKFKTTVYDMRLTPEENIGTVLYYTIFAIFRHIHKLLRERFE